MPRRLAVVEVVRDGAVFALIGSMVATGQAVRPEALGLLAVFLALRVVAPPVLDPIAARGAARQARALLALPCETGTRHVDPARAAIALEHVAHGYPGMAAAVLVDVDLSVDPTAFTVIHGPSGTGKSTLLRILLGIVTPDRGRLLIDGLPADTVDLAAWRRRVAVIMQGQRIEGNATLRAHVAGHDDVNVAEVWRALADVEFDREIAAWPMGLQTLVQAATLSSGEQQRLLIARALVRAPVLLVMDEAINAVEEAMLGRILARLRARGIGLLIVTHSAGVAAMADRAVRLEAGRVAADVRPPPEIPRAPSNTATAAYAESASLGRSPGGHPFRPSMVARYERPIDAGTPLFGPPLPWGAALVAVGLVLASLAM